LPTLVHPPPIIVILPRRQTTDHQTTPLNIVRRPTTAETRKLTCSWRHNTPLGNSDLNAHKPLKIIKQPTPAQQTLPLCPSAIKQLNTTANALPLTHCFGLQTLTLASVTTVLTKEG
jgi:hypothetical protein